QRLRGQPADEAVPPPLRELAAVVDDEARWRDHRHPGDDRRLEFGSLLVIGNDLAVVMIALRDDGITVVRAASHEVELIAALRAHLVIPQTPFRIEGNTER